MPALQYLLIPQRPTSRHALGLGAAVPALIGEEDEEGAATSPSTPSYLALLPCSALASARRRG